MRGPAFCRLVLLLVLAPPAAAGPPGHESPDTTGSSRDARRIGFASGRSMLFFPSGFLFRPAVADPHRPGSAIIGEFHTSTGIEGASGNRFFLKAGGRFGFFRWLPKRPGGRMWQLSLEAGLDAQFDIEHSLDNIGWDGNYGVSLTTAKREGRRTYLIGVLHTSAHVGDEWIERTGRGRVNYTREEVRGAIGWRLARSWRTYAEMGYAYNLGAIDDLMEPLRGQLGLEFESPESLWEGLAGWYAALDIQSWEERDWEIDAALQGGLMMTSAGRTWRLGIQYYDGRVPLGEFFFVSESGFSLGLWSEL